MIKSLSFAALVLAATPALAKTDGPVVPAAAAAVTATTTPQTFTRDGQTYVYTSTTKGADMVIDGQIVNTGEPFHLRVRNGQVSGQVGISQVSFSAGK